MNYSNQINFKEKPFKVGGDAKLYKVEKKIIKINNLQDSIKEEFKEYVKELSHPHILVPTYTKEEDLDIEITPFYKLGNLSENVEHFYKKPDLILELFKQLQEGIEFLHNHDIQHRDLKPENILVESLDPLHVRICDFGRAKQFASSLSITNSTGTLRYMAPEAQQGMPNKNSDWFSLGITLATIVSGGNPFKHESHIFDTELDYNKINSSPEIIHTIKTLTSKEESNRKNVCIDKQVKVNTNITEPSQTNKYTFDLDPDVKKHSIQSTSLDSKGYQHEKTFEGLTDIKEVTQILREEGYYPTSVEIMYKCNVSDWYLNDHMKILKATRQEAEYISKHALNNQKLSPQNWSTEFRKGEHYRIGQIKKTQRVREDAFEHYPVASQGDS